MNWCARKASAAKARSSALLGSCKRMALARKIPPVQACWLCGLTLGRRCRRRSDLVIGGVVPFVQKMALAKRRTASCKALRYACLLRSRMPPIHCLITTFITELPEIARKVRLPHSGQLRIYEISDCDQDRIQYIQPFVGLAQNHVLAQAPLWLGWRQCW